MFKSISIKNYRSFGVSQGASSAKINLGPLTVIVGANSSGKSNIIRAIQYATDPSIESVARSDFFISISAGKERKSPIIEIEIDAEFNGVQHNLVCVTSGTSAKGFTKNFTINGSVYPNVTASSPPTQQLRAALEPFSIFVAPTLRDVDYLNSALGLLPVATRSMVLQSTNGLRDSLKKKLSDVCRELKLPLGVDGVTVDPAFTLESILQNVRLNFNVNDGVLLPISNLGQGHISQAILKVAQLRGGSSVTCIEEPEVHVHPSAIKGIVKALREAASAPGQQIIITTHSAEFINQLNFTELVSVRKHGQRSQIKQIAPTLVGYSSDDVAGMQHKIIRQDQRGVIFLSKKVLLVEGPYDRLVLDTLDRNGDIGLIDHDVMIADMGGKGQISSYHGILNSLDRPHSILIDKDMFVEGAVGQVPAGGPCVDALLSTGVMKVAPSAADFAMLHSAKPSRIRTYIESISAETSKRGVSLVAHGHHDIYNSIVECISSSPLSLRIAAYKAMGGSHPAPTEAIVNPWLESKARSKKMPMVEVVNAFPVSVFKRIIVQIKRAIKELS